jgi:hypothetical protein
MGMVVSSGDLEKRGAGGRGLRGLPPYCDEGVPGLGLPLMSAGSYDTVEGGGLDQSTEPLGVEDRNGDRGCALGIVGGIDGARPRLELGLEPGLEPYAVEAVGRWYLSGEAVGFLYEDSRSVLGLFLKVTRAFNVGERPTNVTCSWLRVRRRCSSVSASREDTGLGMRLGRAAL